MSKPLSGRVAVVAGATRGAGRGIARMLGEAGASVYCTGRSSRTQPNHATTGRPETIEETAEMVTAAGGTGVPVRVDHAVEDEVVALFERVHREQKRLDVLAIVMTGQPASWTPFRGIYTVRALSTEYGFTDIDGTHPDYAVLDAAVEQAKKTYLAPLVEAGRFAKVDWKLASKADQES